MKKCFAACLLLASLSVLAETPQQMVQSYVAEAGATKSGFNASAERGKTFFHQRFANNDKMPGCTSCHTDTPTGQGRHAITGKQIRPLAVSANAERFTDPAKVEKWFGRNCKEVVGRACTPAEKADFVAYMSEVR